MKKLSVIAVLVAIGLVGGFAFAKSMCVPWFIDNAPAAAFLPPNVPGQTAIIYLHNNTDAQKDCTIKYYSQDGIEQALPAGGNTFSIKASSTLAFRPVADDPSSVQGGQESDVARLVPNRPRGTGTDGKANGAIVIGWAGADTDVQGLLAQAQYVSATGAYANKIASPGLVMSYETLLPAGSGPATNP